MWPRKLDYAGTLLPLTGQGRESCLGEYSKLMYSVESRAYSTGSGTAAPVEIIDVVLYEGSPLSVVRRCMICSITQKESFLSTWTYVCSHLAGTQTLQSGRKTFKKAEHLHEPDPGAKRGRETCIRYICDQPPWRIPRNKRGFLPTPVEIHTNLKSGASPLTRSAGGGFVLISGGGRR